MAPLTRARSKMEKDGPMVVTKAKAKEAAKGKSPTKGGAKGKAPTKGKGKVLKAPDERTYLLLRNFTSEVERTYDYNPQDPFFDEASYDDNSYPDRDCVMGLIEKLKMEYKMKCEKEFNNLVSYLKKYYLKKEKGISPEETYNQALQAVIKRTLHDTKKREQISDRIGQYIALKLGGPTKPFLMLYEVAVWDDEILNLIIVTIEELKDLGVHFPELEELLNLTKETLKANAKWKATMAGLLQDYIRSWLTNSEDEKEMMKKWARCPCEIIETSRKKKYPC